MKIYCSNCFYPNESFQKICEKCSKVINWEDESYEDKLIKALLHKDPRIVLRAAEILSNFKSNRTKKHLLKQKEMDLLEKLEKGKSVTIREKAEEAIINIKKRHVI
ncbi:MAG: HEAT repeat domain-containing protein [Candidatus Humimicrobiaceae bacterium]